MDVCRTSACLTTCLTATRVRATRAADSAGRALSSRPPDRAVLAPRGGQALTTGAHVLRGTIVGNRMVNVAVSNDKLFHRAVGIVA